MAHPLSRHWQLDPQITYLNHGAFGACPRVVLDEQSRLRAQLEREPVRFFVRELEPLLDDARSALAAFVGASADDLAFVSNATAGVNAVLRSLRFVPGDELLTTNHAYNACRNVLELAAAQTGARVVVAEVPFPLESADAIAEAVLARASARTRLALIDHVTSPTGIIFPAAAIVAALHGRGIDTLIDGAHAPGMLPLDLDAIGAAYYTGNCHKWLCAPKGVGFLYVRRDRQQAIRPTVISHGANSPRQDRSRFLVEFDWVGTVDPTPILALPKALELLGGLFVGGWPALRAHNHELVLTARRILCDALEVPAPCPDEMLGSLAALPLPDATVAPSGPLYTDPLQDALLAEHHIEVPVMLWPAPPRRLIRVSAQAYNQPSDYVRLAEALGTLLGNRR
jgi:isopenicillin-N epimerase